MDEFQARLKGRCAMVGGAVRDALMGRAPGDRDWVVVGSTPDEMVAAGFRPVGRDFPVFLHPVTHEEYALARTERKSAPGYHGFTFHAAPDVTLEEDLARRDLTINAMARTADGALVDPFHGAKDLADKLLRHVSPAFAEDPVRLLRVARFAARWPDFNVAPTTMALMHALVDSGEVDALVPERVWQELARGLMEPRPRRMLEVLEACGATPRLLPGLPPARALGPLLDGCAQADAPLTIRYACMMQEAPQLSLRLKAPGDCRDLADMLGREAAVLGRGGRLSAQEVIELFDRCDAWRRPERFGELLVARACMARADLVDHGQSPAVPSNGIGDVAASANSESPWPPARRLAEALQRAQGVDTAAVAAQAAARGQSGPAVGDAIRAARLAAIQSGG